MDALEVPSAAPAASETVAFQQLMDQGRRSGRYEIMLSVLVVAEWIYLDWATPFEKRAEELPFWLGEWITLHSGDGFAQVVAYLRGQLDAAWDTLDDEARADVTATFTEAVRLERTFFDASWAGFTVEK
jgi:thiaminase/transcriptional activator TenA